MKTIKLNSRKKLVGAAILLAIAATGIASCEGFLDKKSMSALTAEEVYSDINNIAPLVDGLYTTYRDLRRGREGHMYSIGTDESQQGNFQLISEQAQSGLDKFNGLLNSTSPQVSQIWSMRWPLVSTAARAIDALSSVTPTAQSEVLLGEAYFFRALGMLELSMLFGEIPVVDIPKTTVLGTARQPLSLVWEYILNDFRQAAIRLPATQDQPKRATCAAAWAMLGKAYMCDMSKDVNARLYDSAKVCFERVMGGKRTYSLVPNYATMFSNDRPDVTYQTNTVESIFEVQYANPYPDMNFWQFDCGSRAVDSPWGQGCYLDGYDFRVPTPFAYCGVDPNTNPKYWINENAEDLPFFWEGKRGLWEDGDLRRDVNLRYEWRYAKMKKTTNADGTEVVTIDTMTLDPIKDLVAWTGTQDELQPHIRKWEDLRTDEKYGTYANMWNSAKNLPVIRLADIYLLYAECLHRLGTTGVGGDANFYIQQVRNRAGLTTPMPDPYGDFIKALMDERMRELCFEGWRRYDLLRTGLFVELVSARNRWTSNEHNGQPIPDFYVRYPIPDDEIKTNEDLAAAKAGVPAQNKGYE